MLTHQAARVTPPPAMPRKLRIEYAGATYNDLNRLMTTDDTSSVLDRLLDPISRCFNPESARALAQLKADPVAQTRMGELAEKCNEGMLTPDERLEYETYMHAGNLIAILQAKARLQLKQQAAA